ncbi:hypothetical protein ACWCPS_36160 [Streptomyces mauvecolor]
MITATDAARQLRLTIAVRGRRPVPQGSERYAGHRRNARSGRVFAVLVEHLVQADVVACLEVRQSQAQRRLLRLNRECRAAAAAVQMVGLAA